MSSGIACKKVKITFVADMLKIFSYSCFYPAGDFCVHKSLFYFATLNRIKRFFSEKDIKILVKIWDLRINGRRVEFYVPQLQVWLVLLIQHQRKSELKKNLVYHKCDNKPGPMPFASRNPRHTIPFYYH